MIGGGGGSATGSATDTSEQPAKSLIELVSLVYRVSLLHCVLFPVPIWVVREKSME